MEQLFKKERYYVLSSGLTKYNFTRDIDDDEGDWEEDDYVVSKKPIRPLLKKKYVRSKSTKKVIVKPAKSKPRLVVCLLETFDGIIARGVAVCSLADTWDLQEGKDQAYCYAIDALTNESSGVMIRRERSQYVVDRALRNSENKKRLLEYGEQEGNELITFDRHSYYNVPLTMYELGVMEAEVEA